MVPEIERKGDCCAGNGLSFTTDEKCDNCFSKSLFRISGDYVNTRLSHLQKKKNSLAQGASSTLPSLPTSFQVFSSPEQTSGWQLVQWKGKLNSWFRLEKE